MIRGFFTALLVCFSVTLAACGSGGDTGDAGSASGSGGSGPPAEPDAVPPPPGPAKAPDGTGSVTFAIRKLFLGGFDRNGTPDPENGWKQYGYNVDGLNSTELSTGLCKPFEGAPESLAADGPGGIDNSFGHHIEPVFRGIAMGFEDEVNLEIEEGGVNMLITIDALGADADYNPLSSRLYRAPKLDHAPAFDGSDTWPVSSLSLDDPADVTSAKVIATTSYLAGNTWVGIVDGEIPFALAGSDFGLRLPIKHAVITLELSPDHQSATNGVISGLMATDAFIEALEEIALSFDPSLGCEPMIDSISEQFKQASDILSTGKQSPITKCDAISVGIGFDAARVTLGPIVEEAPPPTCGP